MHGRTQCLHPPPGANESRTAALCATPPASKALPIDDDSSPPLGVNRSSMVPQSASFGLRIVLWYKPQSILSTAKDVFDPMEEIVPEIGEFPHESISWISTNLKAPVVRNQEEEVQMGCPEIENFKLGLGTSSALP